jgi:hypothetical protein
VAVEPAESVAGNEWVTCSPLVLGEYKLTSDEAIAIRVRKVIADLPSLEASVKRAVLDGTDAVEIDDAYSDPGDASAPSDALDSWDDVEDLTFGDPLDAFPNGIVAGVVARIPIPPFACPGCWQGSPDAEALRTHVDVCPSWESASAVDLTEGDQVWIEMDDYVGPLTVVASPLPAIGGGIGVEFEADEDEEDYIVIFDDDEVIRVVFNDDTDDFSDSADENNVFVDERYVREEPLGAGPSPVVTEPQRPASEQDPTLEAMLDQVKAYTPDFAQVPSWVYLSNVRREAVPIELLDVVHEIVNDTRYDGKYDSPIPQLIADKNLVSSADRGVLNDMARDVWARTVGENMLAAAEQITDRLLEDPAQELLTRRKDIDAFVASRLMGTRAGLTSSAQVLMVMKTAHRRNA